MIYVSLEQYDKSLIATKISSCGVDGIILGDIYCQKRMFEYGQPELLECIIEAHRLGLDVIYQTPSYMTERIFDNTKLFVKYLVQRNLCNKILVQDIGFAHAIHALYPDVMLIWSMSSVARNGAENIMHYQYLQQIGVSAIEVTRADRASYLSSIGLQSVYAHERIVYNTVNRECYYMHEYDIWDKDCQRNCLTGTARLVNASCGLDMTIDGYQLGRKYQPSEPPVYSHTEQAIVIFYGVDIDTVITNIVAWKG